MGENEADDPEMTYQATKKIGPDGKFYPEVDQFEGEVGGYVYINTTGASPLYAQTAGQYLHLRTLTVTATGASGATIKLIDGSLATLLTTRLFIKLASGAGVDRTKHIDNLKGPVFFVMPFAVASRKGVHVSWTGVIDPNMPSV